MPTKRKWKKVLLRTVNPQDVLSKCIPEWCTFSKEILTGCMPEWYTFTKEIISNCIPEWLEWGGAAARPRDENPRSRGAEARWAGMSSVRPSETLKRDPKGLKNDQETCSAIVKREKVKSYSEWKMGRLANCSSESEFGTRFEKIFFKTGKSRRLFCDWGMQKRNFPTFAQNLSRNATFLL